MKTTIELPDDLLVRAKKRAAELRRTLRDLIERGLRAELDRSAARPRKRAKIRFVVSDGGLGPELESGSRVEMYEWLRHKA